MSRRLVLVAFGWWRDKDPPLPLGHASNLAALRRVPGLDVRSVVVPANGDLDDPEDVADSILMHAAGCPAADVDIAVGAYVWAEERLKAILPLLRRRGFRGRIILGGPQISYSGAGIEDLYPQADVFVRGYAEDALAAVARTPGRPSVPGVHYAGDDDRCERAEVDLDSAPSPWLVGVSPVMGQHFVRWETARGCRFRCAFCQHREPGRRLKRRTFARSRVLAEVALFCRHDVREIAVVDPVFNADANSIATLRAFAEGGFRGRLSLQCRAELVTSEFLDAAGMLDTRLEFGLQTIHASEGAAIDRTNNIERVDRVLADVRRRGIAHEVSLIFGLPGQTLESFRESVAWCLERRVPVIRAFPLMLLRGTPLDRERHRWRLRERGGGIPIVVGSNSFDQDDWEQMAQVAEALVATQGSHPGSLDGLLRLVGRTVPDVDPAQRALLGKAA